MKKLIDTNQAGTTDTVHVSDGLSNGVKGLITPGTPVNGVVYKFAVDNTAFTDLNSFNPGDF